MNFLSQDNHNIQQRKICQYDLGYAHDVLITESRCRKIDNTLIVIMKENIPVEVRMVILTMWMGLC